RQMASTREMIFTVSQLVAFISSIMTLDPGDLILTGTPVAISWHRARSPCHLMRTWQSSSISCLLILSCLRASARPLDLGPWKSPVIYPFQFSLCVSLRINGERR
ncbi:MAG: fumarylacetoacetate hydrolase family protein, partial [Acidobacteriia bacterium]|nr:fumarylacetoacetate hydrolase family protein [Terriglobia bacterium]